MTKSIDPEKTSVSMSIAKWFAIIGTVIGITWMVASYQHSMQMRIEQLYLQNQQQHEQIMVKLNDMDIRQQMFVLKNQLIEAMVFNRRDRDEQLSNLHSNKVQMTVQEEMAYRSQIKEILDRK